MTVEEVLRLTAGQRAKLSRAELARATSVLASAANKRLKRLEEAGLASSSQAANFIKHGGGSFSVKGKSIAALDAEFQRAAGFLTKPTSTVKGTRKALSNQDTGTANWLCKNGIVSDYENWSEAKKKRFWRFLDGKKMQKVVEQYYGNYRGRDFLKLAADMFDQYEHKKGQFANRGRSSATVFRDAMDVASRAAYEMQAEEEAAEDEVQRALWEGKYITIEE